MNKIMDCWSFPPTQGQYKGEIAGSIGQLRKDGSTKKESKSKYWNLKKSRLQASRAFPKLARERELTQAVASSKVTRKKRAQTQMK